jgi:hypothetical protein
MEINFTDYATVTRRVFVAPTLRAAGVKSAFRMDHVQATSPITGDAGMVTGHRPWSPPIT